MMGNFAFAQQNEEFLKVKQYFDYQRFIINKKMKTQFEKEPNLKKKIQIQDSFYQLMAKIDSVENKNYIYALIVVKNRESLGKLFPQKKEKDTKFQEPPMPMPTEKIVQQDAIYPGGEEALREEVAGLFYFDGIREDVSSATANVTFMVEKNGEISHVKARGEDSAFNTQAEIAVYRLRYKFTPAYVNGNPVRYQFKIPLTMNF